MEAGDQPQTVSSGLLGRPLRWLTRQCLRAPFAVVTAGVVAAIVAVIVAAVGVRFRTSRLDLIDPESGYNRLWIEYIQEFGDQDDAVIVVEGSDRGTVLPVLDELSGVVASQDSLFHSVLHEVDLSKVHAKGLHYLSPDDLAKTDRYLASIAGVLAGDWARLRVGSIVDGHLARMSVAAGDTLDSGALVPGTPVPGTLPNGNEPDQPASATSRTTDAGVRRFVGSVEAALRDQGYQSPWQPMPKSLDTLSELGPHYLLAEGGRLGFVLLRLVDNSNEDEFARSGQAIEELRRLIKNVAARHPDVKVGLTGLPIMEYDEMASSQSAMTKASLISLLGVACLFVAGLGGVRHPLLTVAALLLGICWTFGYLTLFVGHLNILSVSFGVILIGLGIDFGVHYVSCYLNRRQQQDSVGDAIEHTAGRVGPGIVTGVVTTAIAFFTAGFTPFTGIAELGIIAGGGILLCGLAALLVLPALIYVADRRRAFVDAPRPLAVHRWVSPAARFPITALAISIGATVLLGLGMNRLWYDHNLLNLQARGVESVELERKLLSEHGQSSWYALSLADSRQELLAKKQRFLKLDSVERTEEIASLLPIDGDRKRPLIEQIAARLQVLPERPPLIPVDHPQQLGQSLALLERASGQLGDHATARRLAHLRDTLRRMAPATCYARLSRFQQQLAGDLLTRLHTLAAMADPQPPAIDDLPSSLVTRFVGQQGRHLLKIYGRGDIWDMDSLKRFVHQVRSVDPRATGNPLQAYEASREMKLSYELAALYALAAIMAVLWIDLGKMEDMFLALVPVAAGAVQLFGLLGLIGVPLNPANMIVLPLILGIGIDDGVHVIHDFRRQSGRYRLGASTGTAILITSLTTMTGFGTLMMAGHQGLESLGRVLALGVTCCLVNSLVMLPAILSWLSRNRGQATAVDDAEPQSQDENVSIGPAPLNVISTLGQFAEAVDETTLEDPVAGDRSELEVPATKPLDEQHRHAA